MNESISQASRECCLLVAKTAHYRLDNMLLRQALKRLLKVVEAHAMPYHGDAEALEQALRQARKALGGRHRPVPDEIQGRMN